MGIDRQSGQDRGRSQGHWRRVIKERGEGGGRESGCEGLWTPTCDSSGDGHGDECLHLDELVSERPLERAWRSPMTQPAFICRMELSQS